MRGLRIAVLMLVFLATAAVSAHDAVGPSERVESRLNVRTLPDANAPKRWRLEPGESAEYLGTVSRQGQDWYAVRLDQESIGFVASAWAHVRREPPGEVGKSRDGTDESRDGYVLSVVQITTVIVLFLTMLVILRQGSTLKRSMQATTYNQIVDQNLRINELLICHSSNLDAFAVSSGDNHDEAKQRVLASSLIDHFENVFIQHNVHNLPRSVWPGWEKYMAERIWACESLRKRWPDMESHMDCKFREYVNARRPGGTDGGDDQAK